MRERGEEGKGVRGEEGKGKGGKGEGGKEVRRVRDEGGSMRS